MPPNEALKARRAASAVAKAPLRREDNGRTRLTLVNAVQDALKANNITPQAADVSQVADTTVGVDLEDGKKVVKGKGMALAEK